MKPKTSSTSRRGAKTRVRIGYLPLIDAAPLVLADELGLYTKQGLEVDLQPQLGWGSIRSNLLQDHLDAAQTPLGLIFSVPGLVAGDVSEFVVSLILSAQGNAITLSSRLWDQGVGRGLSLRQAVDKLRPRKLNFATVAPYSNHTEMLHAWLRDEGLDPARDVHLSILPPPLVNQHLRAGLIDGFCVGEPWNSRAVLAGEGWIVYTSSDLAPGHPEKVLLTRRDWSEAHPEAEAGLRRALHQACAFAEDPERREELVDIIHRRLFSELPRQVVVNSLISPCELGAGRRCGTSRFCRFLLPDDNLPTEAHGRWLLESRGLRGTALEEQLEIWRRSLPTALASV